MALPPTDPEFSPLERQNVVALEEVPPSAARRVLLEVIETIVLALVLFMAINFLTARIRVDGSSMEPNFHDGDYVIVNRIAYKLGDIQRGDVIVFPFPLDPEDDYIKRVIGLPGDRVAIYGGVLYVNGEPLIEPYIREAPRSDLAELIVPEGYVYVMGDNRNESSDSRSWGPLKIEDVLGKAIFRYWPFSTMGIVEHPDLALASP
ncbi:MAG: signal peptidase I [Chloroflexi bacterium]|nr:signal peptidase I [Chloroflexota bacterium]